MPDSQSSKSFYVTLLKTKKDGNITGHIVSPDPPEPSDEATPLETQPTPQPTSPAPATPLLTFASVFRAFVSVMDSYRKFIATTLQVAPLFYSAFTAQKVVEFVNSKGKECLSLGTETSTVYELDTSCYAEFTLFNDETIVLKEGVRLLPEIMVIGLVSSYDAFLSQLIRVILNRRPEIVLTSEKTIKFSELSTFSSIEDVRATLIDQEVETAIRMSHHEQFAWMEKHFSIKLREDLPVWPRFIELCERRNLLTHTGGIVSAQYLANCKEHTCDVTDIQVGGKLTVSRKYFADSVDIIYEICTKLCHVFWRKFAEAEREEADTTLNDLCYALIYGRSYSLAESLLHFGTLILKKHSSDNVRRTMIVNLANCIRLQNREEEAKQILDREDWSAVDNNFKICVASVYGNIGKVLELMPIIGAKGRPTKAEYRMWPVFNRIRTDARFVQAFEQIFGEPLITSSAVKVVQTADNVEIEVTDNGGSKRTLH
jgi:hypothetical protein